MSTVMYDELIQEPHPKLEVGGSRVLIVRFGLNHFVRMENSLLQDPEKFVELYFV